MLNSNAIHIILISRSKIHGQVLYNKLGKYFQTFWIGWRIPYQLNFINAPLLLFYEFFCLTYFHYFRSKDRNSIILIHFISLDALIAILFKRLFGYKIILYAIGSDVMGIRNPIQKNLLKWTILKADKVLCVNSDIENIIKKIRNNNVFILPTPFLETNLISYDDKKDYDIITIGALIPLKMQELLINSCNFLKPGKTIAIIGKGPSEKFLKNISKKYSYHKILFLGNIPHNEIWSQLKKAKIYVHTSLREGIPSSILEAIWCKLPVITVKASYTDDLVKIYKYHITVVEKRSTRLLAIAIENVIQNYESYLENANMNNEILKKSILNWDDQIKNFIIKGL